MNKWNIEVSEKMYYLLGAIFESLGMHIPNNITQADMEKVLEQMNSIIDFTQKNKIAKSRMKVLTNKKKDVSEILNTLIISQLGIVRYQLKTALVNRKVDVVLTENQYNGLAEYVKKLHDVIIIDFTSITGDMSDVIDEIKRIALNQSIDTHIIGLISPIGSGNKAHLGIEGVDQFIEKKDNWHETVLKKINKMQNTAIML